MYAGYNVSVEKHNHQLNNHAFFSCREENSQLYITLDNNISHLNIFVSQSYSHATNIDFVS